MTSNRRALTPTTKRDGKRDATPSPKVPWHERPLPRDWGEEQRCFFSNWLRELARLHGALTSVAADQTKLLKRARTIHFKLAYKLNEQIREMPTQSRSDAVKAGLQ